MRPATKIGLNFKTPKDLNLNKNNFVTYTNLRESNGLKLPATVQNLILRDYCEKNNILFNLPVEEYIFENCFVEFEGIVSNLKKH